MRDNRVEYDSVGVMCYQRGKKEFKMVKLVYFSLLTTRNK
jgi:hypothetical protein